jgi:hypothetical protein
LTYNTSENKWASGAPFGNDWGSPNLAELNARFGSGIYTINVLGTSVSLNLTGDVYPAPPVLTLTGGKWAGGVYEVDPTKPVTARTSAFTGYGSTRDSIITLGDAVQRYSDVPGSNSLTVTFPAGTLVAGNEYQLGGGFISLVDVQPNALLPGSLNAAYYTANTVVTVRAVPPVFPMTVSGSVTATSANITANIQYRPQDVGSNGNVYVFALAPAAIVQGASSVSVSNHKGPMSKSTNTATTDTALPCVLAQLTASGQLTVANANSLQAYLTGVLSSQGASVAVLNNVSTALIAGSIFYVGYGANSAAMINNGVHRNAVAIPGSNVCNPQAPQTGWWWNPAEDGRGFGIEVRGNNLFMSGYLYDDTGHATWVVSPGPVALDGSFYNGTLYQVANGQSLNGAYRAPATPTSAGTVTLTFNDSRHGTLIWPGGSIPIVRFDDVIGSGGGTTPAFVPENGWWWSAIESGRGYFLEVKNNYAFIAGYMYETDGRPVWYLTQNALTSPTSFSGNWLQVQGGQTLTGPYKKPTVLNANVGSAGIVFQDASNATLTLPNGRQVAITRQQF